MQLQKTGWENYYRGSDLVALISTFHTDFKFKKKLKNNEFRKDALNAWRLPGLGDQKQTLSGRYIHKGYGSSSFSKLAGLKKYSLQEQ
jgi:hypothetical protein